MTNIIIGWRWKSFNRNNLKIFKYKLWRKWELSWIENIIFSKNRINDSNASVPLELPREDKLSNCIETPLNRVLSLSHLFCSKFIFYVEGFERQILYLRVEFSDKFSRHNVDIYPIYKKHDVLLFKKQGIRLRSNNDLEHPTCVALVALAEEKNRKGWNRIIANWFPENCTTKGKDGFDR